MKFSLENHPRLVVVGTLILAAVCLALGVVLFYSGASLPTDENVFMTPPSTIFIARDVPARSIEEPKFRLFDRETENHPGALLTGDAFISVNKKDVKTMEDLQAILRSANDNDSLDVEVLRASINRNMLYRIEKSALALNSVREFRNTVVVISVIPGGASDRAGMKTGDIITKINEQTFADALAADKILRQGQVDKSLRYDVFRDNRELTLQVTLAKFGVPMVVIMFFLIGLFYMGTGVFLALRRPQLTAARLLGWAFIAGGSLLMTAAYGRGSEIPIFRLMRNLLTLWGFIGSITLFTLSFLYFPKEKQALLENIWHRRVVIIAACFFLLMTIVTQSQWVLYATMLIPLYFLVIKWIYRKQIPSEQRAIMRGVKWSVVGILAANAIFVYVRSASVQDGSLPNNLNFLTLLLLPLAYLFTIGRYQLLDMKLRIRRNLQYTVLTVVWNTLLGVTLIVLFFSLPNVALPLQHVEFTGASILITDSPVSKEDLTRNEKIGSMLLGLGAVFAYVLVRRTGQRLIDEKYFQTQFDYRRALSELSEALASKLGMNDLAHGLVTTLADLLNVKEASVLFFRGETGCCCIESMGTASAEVSAVCLTHQKELTDTLKSISGPSRVEYLPVTVRKMLSDLGVRIVSPICSKDRLIGTLFIGEKRSETAFKDEDISFLNSAATQASISIENAFLYEELAEKERMRHELEIARKIQLASLPQEVPLVQGLDIAGGSLPAMEVGGDFFDYLESKGNSVTVIIGDVSGKGTSAALYMSKVQGILRSLFTFGLSPRDLFIRANRLLCKDLEKRSFVTVLGAEFDMASKTARIARAGHLPLYCYNAAACAVEKIITPGIGLGLNDAEQPFSMLEEYVRPLGAGDVYIFVSDGITEAQNEQGEEYGEERLTAFMDRRHADDAATIRDLLFEDVKQFTAGASQHDDQTMVCIAVRG
ncbi:MAG TPA: SpoIIE family protein phosphatase [Bacteroidota bacterium]|nr:SpoIIE family protein phosphatase [Bacteroidota bacterium]